MEVMNTLEATATTGGVAKDITGINLQRVLSIGSCIGNLYCRSVRVMVHSSGITSQAEMIIPTSDVS